MSVARFTLGQGIILCSLAFLTTPQFSQAADGSEVECEGSSVLQTRRSQSQIARSKSFEKMVAFEGNGWLAETDDAGVLVGLLNVLGRKRGMKGTVKELFSQMDGFSSTSGGSWFMAKLAYSASFVKLMESKAKDADSIDLSQAWLDAFVFLGSPVPEQGQTWQQWLESVLKNQSGIPPDMLMGAPVQPWADGLLWMPTTSVPAAATVYMQTSRWSPKPDLQYSGHAPSNISGFPTYLPAGLDIILRSSDNEDAKSVFSFCARPDCFNLTYDYSLDTGSGPTQQIGPPLGKHFEQMFRNIGKLPLSGVLAASSTGLSFFAVIEAQKFLQFQYVIYAAQNGTEEPFNKGETLRTSLANSFSETLANEAIAAGISLLMDGAYTSNPAILHSLWVGATNVVSVTNVQNSDLSVISAIFGTQQDTFGPAPPGSAFSAVTFQTLKKPSANFNIYDYLTTFDVNVSKTNQQHNLVQHLWYGSIKTETLGNRWAGVEDGRAVTLDCIIVDSTLSVEDAQMNGSVSDGLLFQSLVEIIMDPANKAHADVILSDFFEIADSDYHHPYRYPRHRPYDYPYRHRKWQWR